METAKLNEIFKGAEERKNTLFTIICIGFGIATFFTGLLALIVWIFRLPH